MRTETLSTLCLAGWYRYSEYWLNEFLLAPRLIQAGPGHN